MCAFSGNMGRPALSRLLACMLPLRHLAQTLTESAGKEHLFLLTILAEIQVIAEKTKQSGRLGGVVSKILRFGTRFSKLLAVLQKYGQNMALMCN